jgi:hypothetical protein
MLFYRSVDKRLHNNSFDFIPCCLYLGEDTNNFNGKGSDRLHKKDE